MEISVSQFEWAKDFVGFTAQDAAQLVELGSLIADHGGTVTDYFYEVLGRVPETAKVIEGRVDALKRTHGVYMRQLVAGDYGEAYFESRIKVGKVHVVQGIEPHWVEAVMSIIRTQLIGLISEHYADAAERAAKSQALLRICDLDLLLINFAYAEERLDRLSKFTGMGRRLIENVIKMPPRK
ncbi:MAG: protoglobin domain-containing protein [bacterium]